MKKRTFLLSLTMLFCLLAGSLKATADTPVKREMRSAWVATVWRIDWPSVVISSTGNQSQIDRQKQDMIQLLDSLHINNFNAINFQVRSRSDAFYKSSYEPWSSDLVATRGMDPGWDPLEWIVEECHKRGMECHAWVNPYRYESQTGQWNGTDKCYRETHPEWILDVNGASILNPARQDVIDQIVRVIREIVQNYNIDGVLFDDYFYLSGTPTGSNGDGDQYQAYLSAGGTLSQADWRRENVNNMIKAVYNMIQEEKPWVRFGVSPAGIACTSASVARKYGISPCPTGSDWQYNDIYSDPIAWLSNRSLDFISPQIYWTIGNSTDYDKAAKWWSEVANKFGRHFYSSHSISELTATSTASGKSLAEQNILNATAETAVPLATGPNSGDYTEYSNQIRLNREYTLNDAPGSIFYSCKYIYKTSPKFGHHLRKYVFNTPALVPAMTHKPGNNPGLVKNLSLNGNTLSWEGYDNVRYTVYAVPTSVPIANFDKDAEYLVGTSYSTSYEIPVNKRAGYNLAVCVLDRLGYEYSPVFLGKSTEALDAPTLTYPANGESLEAPFDFTWTAVTNASGYLFELSDKEDFSSLIATQMVYTNSISTAAIENFPLNKTLYWRVRSMGNSYSDGISGIFSFKANQLLITSPADESTDVSTTPTIHWSISRNATIEIYSDELLSSLVYTANGSRGTHTVPMGNLSGMTKYYLRLKYTRNSEDCYTPVVCFTTKVAEQAVPTFTFPKDGGEFNNTHSITLAKLNGHTRIDFELAASSSFPSRSRFSKGLMIGTYSHPVNEIKISSKELVPGTLYYLRARATYLDAEGNSVYTAYSPVISATYLDEAGVDGIESDNNGIRINGNIISLGDMTADVYIYSTTGSLTAAISDATGETLLPELPAGVYIIKVNDSTLKYISK